MSDRDLRQYNRFIAGIFSDSRNPFDFADKSNVINQHIFYMLNRTQSMFKWSNLPKSIPQRILELYLQINGNVCFYHTDGDLYIFTGGLGGKPDVYYRPTIYTIANPGLDISRNLEIDKDCIVMPNDSLYLGLIPMFSRYATMISETELSMKIALVNSRTVSLISAADDRTKSSAEKYLDDLEKGKLGVIAENQFLDGVRSQPYAQGSHTNILTNLIEVLQYNKASWFNEMGLNANYNMKRESINSGESQLNNDALLPLVDDMLNCRKIAAEKVNDMFGASITVDLASSWEDNLEEIEAEQKAIENNSEGDADSGIEETVN